jgi:hypothetical protein
MKRWGGLSVAVWAFLCVFDAGALAEDALVPDEYESESRQAAAQLGELRLEGDIAAPRVERTIDANFYGDLDQHDWYSVTLRDESLSPSCFMYRLRFEVSVTPTADVLLTVGLTTDALLPGASPYLAIVELWVNSCGSVHPYVIHVQRGPGTPVPTQYALRLRLNREILQPLIKEISPTSGPVGTTVTVTGQGLLPYLKFNGTNASVTSYTPTSITAAVPPRATTGPISVHTAVSQQIFTVTSKTTPPPGSAGASGTTPPFKKGGSSPVSPDKKQPPSVKPDTTQAPSSKAPDAKAAKKRTGPKPNCIGLGCDEDGPICIGMGCGETAPRCIGMGCEKKDAAVPEEGGPTGAANLPSVQKPTVHGLEPCCNITSIAAGGLVTAQDRATGKSFQFQAKDQALINSLHIGQNVYANFGTQQVSVDGATPCCGMVSGASAPTGAVRIP